MTTAKLNPDIVGREVFDARGQHIGRLDSVYRDVASGAVCFGAVAMLRRGRRRLVFVSLIDATVAPASVTVRCGSELARRAPQTRPGQTLAADREPDLYTHYDLPCPPNETGAGRLERCD